MNRVTKKWKIVQLTINVTKTNLEKSLLPDKASPAVKPKTWDLNNFTVIMVIVYDFKLGFLISFKWL